MAKQRSSNTIQQIALFVSKGFSQRASNCRVLLDEIQRLHKLLNEKERSKMAEEQLEMQDCYLKAEDGEPKFTLLARDPLAAYLVGLWAALRKGDTPNAVCIFADIIADPAHNYRVDPSLRQPEKIASACKIFNEMIAWRESKGLENFEIYNVT